ncbi:acanthoscurrin-1-like isoform X2 [Hylaeus anthracinus]|uniref:acanthoscurrin-1-like isoform X2 n=1 Tax=Hylaeus anthracinus TaxID=313031 RepID=UPI0023B92DB4|nr:acanthoscurrin-1-like isoform X2 [Hylaeus anthracinus]
MVSRYFLVLSIALLLFEHIHAAQPIPYKTELLATRNDQDQGHLVRQKRSPFGKLLLIGGAALGAKALAKKALLLGGAALGAKALIGAKVVGAGLLKAKSSGGSYSGGSYSGGSYSGGAYAGGYASQKTWSK